MEIEQPALSLLLQSINENLFLMVVGVLSAIYVTLKMCYLLYSGIKIYFTECNLDLTTLGKWALVTGSTDGIGKGIARELASLGINIVLVSRNPEKLKRVAEEIEEDFHVEVKCVTFDFTQSDGFTDGQESHPTKVTYDIINDVIKNLEIGILVNNVATAPKLPNVFLNYFGSTDDLSDGISDLINCNAVSMAKMTQLVLPKMVNRSRGLILNLSSTAASFTCPMSALYSGSKKFNDTFSRALSYEYQSKGIIIQSIQPGLVITSMTELLQPENQFSSISYQKYAHYMMKTIGKGGMTHGYWLHAILKCVIREMSPKTVILAIKTRIKNGRN